MKTSAANNILQGAELCFPLQFLCNRSFYPGEALCLRTVLISTVQLSLQAIVL